MTGQAGSDAEVLDQDVRLYVFRQAAETGQVPTPAEIAAARGRPQPEIEESLRRLAARPVLILAPGSPTAGCLVAAACPRSSAGS